MKANKLTLLGILVAAVVSISITVGIFAFPNAVGVVYDNSNSICQKSLDFGSTEANFVINFKNIGNDNGVFSGSVSSNEVLSKYKNSNQAFTSEISQDWVVEKGNSQPFQFILTIPESNDPPETVSITTNLTCKKDMGLFYLPCGFREQICAYQNQNVEHFGPEYILISD